MPVNSGDWNSVADILEMTSSGFSREDTAVLVMLGGSDDWKLNPGMDGTVIMEIGPGRQRIVRRSEKMNMGSRETLTELLRFGIEKYPAEDYALILLINAIDGSIIDATLGY